MHFIVQENINKEDFKEFTDAIVNLGHTFESFYHKPFDNSYPEIDTRKPTFIYAASSVTDAIFDEYNGFAGVFNHTRQFLKNITVIYSMHVMNGLKTNHVIHTIKAI